MSDTANAARGEMSMTLDGRDFVLRPSYDAIKSFEASTGKGLLVLARDAQDGALSLDQAALITTACINAWGREIDDMGAKGANARKIAEHIIESDGGLANILGVLSVVLAMAVTGGVTASGEVKAPAMTMKKTQTPAGA